MNARSTRPRGFTLIELMVVGAIMGILASIAVPEFRQVTLRARAAERRTIMTAIQRCVSDVTLNRPNLSGTLFGDWNPNAPVDTTKHRFDSAQAGWDQLALQIEGRTYYSYTFLMNASGLTPTLDITAVGDLDGDGAQSTKTVSYVGVANAFVQKIETPEAGQEDLDTF
jgi:type IV pilus assembly protein PilA